MKRGLVIGGIGLGVIVLAAVIVFVFVLSNLDSIVKAAVEKYGSEVTRVEVTLAEVDISPTSGKGELGRLVVGNPRGFKTDSAFRLGRVAVELDVGSLAGDTVLVRRIAITAPEVTYELGDKGNNIDAIRRNVAAYLGPAKKTEAGAPAPADGAGRAKDDAKEPRLVIDDLVIRGGRVSVSATLLEGKRLTAPLPDIRLRDIGKDKGGASPGEVVERVLTAVGDGAAKAVASLDVEGLVGGVGKGAAEALEKRLKGIGGPGGGEAGGAVEKGADEAGKALKRLLGR